MQQTKQLRKTDEEIDEEIIEEKQQKFFDKRKNQSIKIKDPQGNEQKIPVAQFMVNPDQLFQ